MELRQIMVPVHAIRLTLLISLCTHPDRYTDNHPAGPTDQSEEIPDHIDERTEQEVGLCEG